jgi:hypothetical protein
MSNRERLRRAEPRTEEDLLETSRLTEQINHLIAKKQTNAWEKFLEDVGEQDCGHKLWKTIKTIHTRKTQKQSHESMADSAGNPITPQQQANKIMDFYSSLSRLPTIKQNRITAKAVRKVKTNSRLPPPFKIDQIRDTIRKLRNTPATGPDGVSNLHLKHLSQNGLKALTDIINQSWIQNVIPNIRKQANIIPILKPGKPANTPSSFRPISLLCTSSKVAERLILNKIKSQLPTAPHQHGFRPMHSTTTYLTELSQYILNGFNSTQPHKRTVIAQLDINKAFDTVPRHILMQKIINTDMSNNDKRWLSNFISGRQGRVCILRAKSHFKLLANGVPQGAVLSPQLFNLFTHDIPTPPANSNTMILSYADDITIAAQGHTPDAATNLLQEYLGSLQIWLKKNRLTVSPAKSTSTLFTNYTHENNYNPQLSLNGAPIPLNKSPQILGLKYDTHMTFTPHTTDSIAKTLSKTNVLKALTGTKFGCQQETITKVYRQYVRTNLNYASPAWAPAVAKSNLDRLQVAQNGCLRTATGCVKSTQVQHLHDETKVLPIRDHLNMIGTQFIAKIYNPAHPNHNLTSLPRRSRHMKQTPYHYYNQQYAAAHPPHGDGVNTKNFLHTHFTQKSISNAEVNKLLNTRPPLINKEELNLTRQQRTTLSRLRSGQDFHPGLNTYQNKLNSTVAPHCPQCPGRRETVKHLIIDCDHYTTARRRWNLGSLRDLWERPVAVAGFLGETSWPRDCRLGGY